MSMMVDSGTPALRSSRAAERLKSWTIRPTYFIRLLPQAHFSSMRTFSHSRKPCDLDLLEPRAYATSCENL